MEDLFNFSNTDNILGNPKNIPTPQAGFATNLDQTTNDDNKETSKKENKKKESYKIVLVGDPQVGKTAFLTKHLNGSFDSQYRATMGASTFHLEFNTNLDTHKFECMDVAGQDIFAGKRDDYYKNIRGAIIMYDVMNWSSYDNITDIWLRELKEKAPSGTPICVVGNKMENRDTRKVSVEVVAEAISNTFEPKGIGYCEISVKTNQNLAEPFLFLTKQILKIHDSKAIYFVSKISELNLIESMLQHKKKKKKKNNENENDKQSQIPNDDKSQSLDNLFLNSNTNINTNNNGKNTTTTTKGGDYLDDIIFKIGDDNNKNKKSNKTNDSNMEFKVDQSDDNFLANMMNEPLGKSKSHETSTKVIPPSKAPTVTTRSPKGKSQSISPKNINQSTQKKQSQSQSQRNRSSSSSTNNNNNKTRAKPQLRSAANNLNSGNSNDVMIDILLGIQETLNNLTSDVRRLQNDVSYLKQEFKNSKSQRK